MPAEPSDRPVLDPDDIAGHSFTKSRKGYEVDEVRAFLVNIGSRVRESQQRYADMERRVAELERRAVDPKDLDEAAVTALLGEETARVLDTARRAGNEMRAKAQEEADAITAAAAEESTATRDAADEYAAGVRSAADEQATTIRTEADTYAEEQRRSADTDTAAQRTAADEYAAEVRAAADAEVAELRSTSETELDRLRTQAETVVADRTAEAEVASSGIRADADAYSGRVRDEADRYAEAARAAADSYRADVQGAADAYRDTATADGDRLKADAEADAASTNAAAVADAASIREDAEREREVLLSGAREEGRAMVEEARAYRERVITDLADRRLTARAKLAEMAATRDSFAGTLDEVAAQVEAARRALREVVIDPRAVGESWQDRQALEGHDLPGTAVAVGEVTPSAGTGGATEVTEATDDHGDAEPADADTASADEIFARLRAEQEGDGSPATAPPEPTATVEIVDEPEADEAAEEAPEPGLDAADEPEPADADAADDDEAVVEEMEIAEEEAEDPDTELLDLRDATTDDLERQLARRLKRVLSDEQNEALDLLRRSRGAPRAEEVLPTEADHLDRYASAALEDLVAAERAGASFFGDPPRRAADVADAAADFAADMVRQIRGRLERAFEDGGDENEVAERIRACYREWKTQRIGEVARHSVVVAFSRGVAEAATKGAAFRWLVDDGGVPCPDCDDNALAGPTPKGEPFPTGDLFPPAHEGCRCLAVPVDAE